MELRVGDAGLKCRVVMRVGNAGWKCGLEMLGGDVYGQYEAYHQVSVPQRTE